MPTLRAWLFLARMWTVWGHDQACGMAEARDGRCLRSSTDDPSLLQFQVARHPSSNDNSSGRRFNLSSGLGHAANSHGNSTHWHGNRSDHPGPVLIEESELNEKNKKKANVTLTADRVKNKDSFTEWLKTWWTSESECADKWLCLCEESLRTSCGWTAQVTLYMYSVYWINPQGLPSRGVHEAGAKRCGGWMLSKTPRVMGTSAKCSGGGSKFDGYLNAKEVIDNFDLIVGNVKPSFWQKQLLPLFPRSQQFKVFAGVIFVQTETMSHPDLGVGYDHVFNIEYFDGQCTVLQSWVEKFTLGSWLGVSKENPYNWICLQDPSNWKEATGSLKDEAEGCEQWHFSRENYGNGKELPCHKINIVELYTSLCSFSFYTKGKEEKKCNSPKACKAYYSAAASRTWLYKLSFYPQRTPTASPECDCQDGTSWVHSVAESGCHTEPLRQNPKFSTFGQPQRPGAIQLQTSGVFYQWTCDAPVSIQVYDARAGVSNILSLPEDLDDENPMMKHFGRSSGAK